MNDAKHTPGPWVVRQQGEVLWVGLANVQLGHGAIAEIILEQDHMADIDFANARLIAAAPDMLEALRFTASELPQESNACLEARAAIAKAEGRK